MDFNPPSQISKKKGKKTEYAIINSNHWVSASPVSPLFIEQFPRACSEETLRCDLVSEYDSCLLDIQSAIVDVLCGEADLHT